MIKIMMYLAAASFGAGISSAIFESALGLIFSGVLLAFSIGFIAGRKPYEQYEQG